ncbi:uncharacterized protein LOC118431301 [Branchiostoma floridae]|uniref:Uncharacterized protein LOC118431301 n=2 Tax=Branchiostoma floridae TaxID=7739 RepID=A0A9J7MBP6_BRAFL|nr:uncharacterized protein LOC118431301 [Branchiostoma floridae]
MMLIMGAKFKWTKLGCLPAILIFERSRATVYVLQKLCTMMATAASVLAILVFTSSQAFGHENVAKVFVSNALEDAEKVWLEESEDGPDNSNDVLPSKGHQQAASWTAADLEPDRPAPPFKLWTLDGVLTDDDLKGNPVIFHGYNSHSGFLECLWTSNASRVSLIDRTPNNTHYVFMTRSENAYEDARWMKGLMEAATQLSTRPDGEKKALMSRLHYVVTPVHQLGNWMPALMNRWSCEDHGCGLPQVLFTSSVSPLPLILKRLDARYDWLMGSFPAASTRLADGGNGCAGAPAVENSIAWVSAAGNCSFFTKVRNMMNSKALGVLVYAPPGTPLQDMNCEGDECGHPLNIRATMVHWDVNIQDALKNGAVNVTFQTTPSDNFYFAIDTQGKLAEIGWLLYPSFLFFTWQAQWFNYKTDLYHNLASEAKVINVFNRTVMQGDKGVVATVKLPSVKEMLEYSNVELDMSLSCPGTRDDTCPHWDHTIQLYVCCDEGHPLCGMELGRWITSFRRRIGRWLTPITPLLPLFTSNVCTFTMKTVPWAMPWVPSLNVRFSGLMGKQGHHSANTQPYSIIPLFRGGTFNKTYNTKYKPQQFVVPKGATQVKVVSVITGHGSDENGCGEFCVTSHHFVVNNHTNVRVFKIAGTPLGCADRVPEGVTPNEHGTWLYGRDGWCDGQEINPWVVDVTSQVSFTKPNNVSYYGWYNGGDPNPQQNPGYIIMYSYLVFYRDM